MTDAQSIKTQINHAVRSHKMWKERLQEAIETGCSEWTPDHVAADDRCDFGKWLNEFPESHRERKYNNVKDLHAEFHREASKILALALEGEKETAQARIGIGSHYDKLTTKLQISLELWRDLNI